MHTTQSLHPDAPQTYLQDALQSIEGTPFPVRFVQNEQQRRDWPRNDYVFHVVGPNLENRTIQAPRTFGKDQNREYAIVLVQSHDGKLKSVAQATFGLVNEHVIEGMVGGAPNSYVALRDLHWRAAYLDMLVTIAKNVGLEEVWILPPRTTIPLDFRHTTRLARAEQDVRTFGFTYNPSNERFVYRLTN